VIVMSILVVTVIAALAATMAPTGRTQDQCGSYADPAPLKQVAAAVTAEIDAGYVPPRLSGSSGAFGGVGVAEVRGFCRREHQARLVLTLGIMGVGILAAAVVAPTPSRRRRLTSVL
jgi:hypothetical protein